MEIHGRFVFVPDYMNQIFLSNINELGLNIIDFKMGAQEILSLNIRTVLVIMAMIGL